MYDTSRCNLPKHQQQEQTSSFFLPTTITAALPMLKPRRTRSRPTFGVSWEARLARWAHTRGRLACLAGEKPALPLCEQRSPFSAARAGNSLTATNDLLKKILLLMYPVLVASHV